MDELIDALRWCGSEDERHEMCVDESYRCPMWNEDRITDECKAELMRDAADAIERLMDEVELYRKKENALKSLIDGRGDPVSCNVDAILKGEFDEDGTEQNC